MNKIGLLGIVWLFISQFSFAGPVTITYDFWHSAPHVYDGHLVLQGETDAQGNISDVSNGTIDLAGAIYDFSTTNFSFKFAHTVGSRDFYLFNVYGNYTNSVGDLKELWARYEGSINSVPTGGDSSFVDVDYRPSNSDPSYPGLRLSVVDVPEPAPFILLGLGLIGLLVNRTRRSNS